MVSKLAKSTARTVPVNLTISSFDPVKTHLVHKHTSDFMEKMGGSFGNEKCQQSVHAGVICCGIEWSSVFPSACFNGDSGLLCSCESLRHRIQFPPSPPNNQEKAPDFRGFFRYTLSICRLRPSTDCSTDTSASLPPMSVATQPGW